MNERRYTCGLDIGTVQDFTALCVVESSRAPDPSRPGREALRHAVRHLERYPLGTPYVAPDGQPSVVSQVKALVSRPPLPGCALAADMTGVGRGVVDALRSAGLPCVLHAVTITAGDSVRRERHDWWVPKRELVAALQVLLGSGRLLVSPRLPLAGTLREELRNFKVKITRAGNETYEAWRQADHDDLVLSVAVACFVAERGGVLDPGTLGTPPAASSPFAAPGGPFVGSHRGAGWRDRRW